MQLKLLDPATGQVYPMRDDVYLRGSVVTWYSQNHWRRTPPPNNSGPDSPVAARELTAEARRRGQEGKRSGIPHRPSGRAADYHGTLPGSATTCSTSGRWSNPSGRTGRSLKDRKQSALRPVQRPTDAEAQFQPRAPRRQFQVRSASPAGWSTGIRPRWFRPAERSAVSPYLQMPGDRSAPAPADGPGRAMAAGKRPAGGQALRSRPLVRAAALQFRPVPVHPARSRSGTRRSTPSRTSFPTIPAGTASTLPRPWP